MSENRITPADSKSASNCHAPHDDIWQAELDWQNGQPYSQQFGDIYFSTESGLAESQHVFLQHNHLSARWKTLDSSHFTIAETGFGTGLNFLCAWDLWKKTAPDTARLNFVSTEKYPLNPHDLKLALALWPSVAHLSHQLQLSYRHLAGGMHRLSFEHGRVTLTLLIGDASDMLGQLHASVDAWFLDGFAPSKNPDMWQAALFEQMGRLSHDQTTFSTFTSAGMVRRNLQQAGFMVEKVSGYGRKREMLCGRYATGKRHSVDRNLKAIVVGAGIAGCSTSRALALRGSKVTLVERHASIATEASGNLVAVLYPRLAMQETIMSRLALAGFLHTNRLLDELALAADAFSHCGLLQLAFDVREIERCKAVSALGLPEDIVRRTSAAEASRIAGIEVTQDALYFPQAGWVKPKVFCQALIHHPNIQQKLSTEAVRIEKKNDLWQVWDGKTLLDEAPVLVIAAANESLRFEQTAHLPLQPVRGQISIAPLSAVSQKLKTVICTDGYISPAIDGLHCLGATFSPDDTALDIRDGDHQANLAMLGKISTELQQGFNIEQFQGRAALRVATPDYLPLVGPVLDADVVMQDPPKHYNMPPALPYYEGLFINTGHGSKGITQAPICAELLASAIYGEPLPVASGTVSALDPNRFLLRKLGLKHFVHGLLSLDGK